MTPPSPRPRGTSFELPGHTYQRAERAEPRLAVEDAARAVVYMAGLPLDANVANTTGPATRMPYGGRGCLTADSREAVFRARVAASDCPAWR